MMADLNNENKNRKIIAEVVKMDGICNAGHKIGDTFELSCHKTGGLCGFFYHDLFPRISVIQYGGRYPWWSEKQSVFEYVCQDRKVNLTLRLEIVETK